MSQFPRRSPRLQGDRPEVHGSHSHDHADGEDVVSLTASWTNSRVANRPCIHTRHHNAATSRAPIVLPQDWPQISFHWRIVAWSCLPFTLPVPGVLHRGHTQWLCLSCSRTFRVEDVPPLPEASCPEWQRNSGAVLDVTTGDVRRECTLCGRVVSVPDSPVPSSDWFSSGPLCQLSPLYGWDSPTLSQPGEGTQSWLFCPLISLVLLVVETRFAVLPFSTGPRAPVPDGQIQFWTHHAPDIIVAFAVHFSSISRDDPVAVALSSPSSWGPSGDHLVACLQEALTPP